jgi:hypothetical protein
MRRHRSIERDFPHIVEIIVPKSGLGGARDAMNDFHARHGVQARPKRGRYKDGSRYVRWCFADPDIAEAFATKFAKDSIPVKTPARVMPRDGAILFADLIGKLDLLRVACDKCGRDGCYGLSRLIERRGRDAKLIDWLDELTADCPKKQARNMNDPCGARCPQLPKVL